MPGSLVGSMDVVIVSAYHACPHLAAFSAS